MPILPEPPPLPTTVLLVVGVLTFNFSGRAGRRAWIRRLSPISANARTFFVLPQDQPDLDSGSEDVIHFDIPRTDRSVLGKYLLQNRWFAFASLLPDHVKWVARMDDDAAVNAAAMAGRLLLAPHQELTVYGPHRNWYMWHSESMQAVCWEYTPVRWWYAQLEKQKHVSSPPSPPSAPADERTGKPRQPRRARFDNENECTRKGVDGPFPFAAGPFMAYSRGVVKFLLPMFLADEAYVVGPRRQSRLVNARTGYVAAPTHKSHPSKRIFMEEVYYAYMLFRELHNASRAMVLIHEPMHEIYSRTKIYPDEPIGGFGSTKMSHEIFHKLRYASHFETLFNSSYLTDRVRRENNDPLPRLSCERLGTRWYPALQSFMSARYGLSSWQRCEFDSVRWPMVKLRSAG